MKRIGQAGVVLLALGILKLPLEEALTQRLRAQNLLSPPLSLDVRENVGQVSFAAALGGLRSLVASVIQLEAYTAFENVDWAKVDSLYQLVTRLQPRAVTYWEQASWHMAYDAASSYLYDPDLTGPVKGRLYQEHVERGIQVLQEGMTYLPQSARLWARLGDIYKHRTKQPDKAGEAYLKAAELGGQPFLVRAAAYEFAVVPDDGFQKRAYDLMKERYDAGDRYPTLLKELRRLEGKFDVPAVDRIPVGSVR